MFIRSYAIVGNAGLFAAVEKLWDLRPITN